MVSSRDFLCGFQIHQPFQVTTDACEHWFRDQFGHIVGYGHHEERTFLLLHLTDETGDSKQQGLSPPRLKPDGFVANDGRLFAR